MLTELDIVNSMLRTIGVGGLTSTDTQHPDYMEALQVLKDVKTGMNKLGYWYNTSYPTLALNTTGEIILPANTLHCDPVDRSNNYVKRGSKLFDQDNQTFIFTDTVQVKLVLDLSIDEMPETPKDYLRAAAREEFYSDNDGDLGRLDRLTRRRQEKWAEFYREHIRNRDINHRDSPSSRAMHRGVRGSRSERAVNGYFYR